ncbi:hypothetical protein Tsubulata_007689 [Turnera subulata]|uniref:Protein TIFY n=1 Tax=Turnera subulata TaxID=218843 RepID=A0A9Q0FQI6_9ROSI|nr:hypothetical protein Tsubulata_007689 [Turnera subulata]
MASSPEFVEFSGQKTGMRLPEKSSFSQTCNLLSQYLKEKGSFGDLGLGMTCNMEANANGNGNVTPEMLRSTATTTTTMNLFPMSETPCWNSGTPRNLRSMDLFPQQAGFLKEDAQKTLDSRPKEPQTAQMTIFYGGQVIVFNDFPADKAKEVMLLAGKGNMQSSKIPFASGPASGHPSTFAALPVPKPTSEPANSIPPTANSVPRFGNTITQDRVKSPAQAIASDLPIARRASLHRFLEKRKDRLTSRAPYQTSSPFQAPGETKSWLGLAAQAQK